MSEVIPKRFRSKLVVLCSSVAVLAAGAMAVAAVGHANQAEKPPKIKLPVCHNVGTPHAKTLHLPVKATVNHLLPSLVDPTPSHYDGLGDCADNPLTVEPPAVSLRHVKIPFCHQQGDAAETLTLSIRDTLYHLFLGVLVPDPEHEDALGLTCEEFSAPPPPPPPSPPPAPEPPPPPGF